jgi:hypothetical protein
MKVGRDGHDDDSSRKDILISGILAAADIRNIILFFYRSDIVAKKFRMDDSDLR